MAIDFTLTTAQRKLQFEARKFAKELLADARGGGTIHAKMYGSVVARNVLQGYLGNVPEL